MSAFLGHIHYWLYRKIQLLVERENLILEKTTKVVDDLAEELHSISVFVILVICSPSTVISPGMEIVKGTFGSSTK